MSWPSCGACAVLADARYEAGDRLAARRLGGGHPRPAATGPPRGAADRARRLLAPDLALRTAAGPRRAAAQEGLALAPPQGRPWRRGARQPPVNPGIVRPIATAPRRRRRDPRGGDRAGPGPPRRRHRGARPPLPRGQPTAPPPGTSPPCSALRRRELVARTDSTLRGLLRDPERLLRRGGGDWERPEVRRRAPRTGGAERRDPGSRWHVRTVRIWRCSRGRGDRGSAGRGRRLAQTRLSAATSSTTRRGRPRCGRPRRRERGEASLDLLDLETTRRGESDDVLPRSRWSRCWRFAGAREGGARPRRSQPDCPLVRYCVAMAGDADPAGGGRCRGGGSAGEAHGWAWRGRAANRRSAIAARRRRAAAAVRPGPRGARALRRARSEAWCRRLEALLRSWGERAPTRAGRRRRGPLAPRAGGPGTGRRGPDQPPDRRAAGGQPPHRRAPRREPVGQARARPAGRPR